MWDAGGDRNGIGRVQRDREVGRDEGPGVDRSEHPEDLVLPAGLGLAGPEEDDLPEPSVLLRGEPEDLDPLQLVGEEARDALAEAAVGDEVDQDAGRREVPEAGLEEVELEALGGLVGCGRDVIVVGRIEKAESEGRVRDAGRPDVAVERPGEFGPGDLGALLVEFDPVAVQRVAEPRAGEAERRALAAGGVDGPDEARSGSREGMGDRVGHTGWGGVVLHAGLADGTCHGLGPVNRTWR